MAAKVVVDRRRDIAYVLLLVAASGLWFGLRSESAFPGGHPWVLVVQSIVYVILALGIWRAAEWSRQVSGWLAAVEAVRFCIGTVEMLVRGSASPSARVIVPAIVLVFAIWWGAMAYYLLKPTTKALFAHVRAARGIPRAA